MVKKVNIQLKNWVDTWKRAGAELEKLRIAEMRRSVTSESMRALSDAFDSAVKESEIPSTSGLVEQQKYFMLSRKNASAN